MSTYHHLLVVGLSVSVIATAPAAAFGQEPGATPAGPAATPDAAAEPARADESVQAPPSSVTPEAAAPSSRTVLMMTDGNVRIFDAEVVEETDAYVVRLPAGDIRVDRDQVEARFATVREAYAYRRDHLPDRDPDERLKLAQWCLEQDLTDEAMEQLRGVLDWDNGNRRAEAMLRNLRASATLASRRPTADPNVARAGAVLDAMPAGLDPGRPRELDPSVILQMRRNHGPVSTPQIFDLPEATAVARFREFARTVHPVLQNRCARCHDEESDRNFRIIRARVPKDMTNALLVKTNLGAALGLIDRANPAHSPLLVNAALPHGPEQRPILPDPGSPEYRALWTWIESLERESSPAAPAPPGVFTPGAPTAASMTSGAYGGGFGSRRGGPVPTVTAPQPAPIQPTAPYADGSVVQTLGGTKVHESVPPDADFNTVSPLLGGPSSAPLSIDGRTIVPPTTYAPSQEMARPTAPAPPPTVAPAPPSASPIAPPPGTPGQPVVRPEVIVQPDGSKLMRMPDGSLLPYMDGKALENSRSDDGESKQFKIDPALLQNFQQRRHGGG